MKAYGITDKGLKRKSNEDNYFIENNKIGALENLYIVCDGMGGHQGGAIASLELIEGFKNALRKCDEHMDREEVINVSLAYANKSIYTKSILNKNLNGMGTTGVILTISEKIGNVLNVGDSRLYTFKNNKLIQETTDHTYVNELIIEGKLSVENAKIHPNKNIITRAVGIGDSVEIENIKINLEEVKYVLMCTDGLTNMLEDNIIEQILRSNDEIEKIGNTLIKKANEKGGLDNITIILIKL